MIGEVGRDFGWVVEMRIVRSARPVGRMPQCASGHDHVSRWRADAADPGSHVIGGIEDHALSSQSIDVGRIQNRIRIVDTEIERRLIVGNDEEEIRPLVSSREAWEGEEGETS